MLIRIPAITLLLTMATLFTQVSFAQESTSTDSVDLTNENVEAWRKYILPVEDELTWQKIAWHASFADGILAANEADKPLLLWVMNGHPFGCT